MGRFDRIRKNPVLSRIGTILLFLAMLLILLSRIKKTFNWFDEGFTNLYGSSVLLGKVPYRDFNLQYPPGQAYVEAILFKLFGVSSLVTRLYDTIVFLAIALGVYLIAKKVGAGRLAALAGLVTTLLLIGWGVEGYPVLPALACGIFSIYCALEDAETGQRRWLVFAGTLIGIAFFFRWDLGLYAGISVSSTLLLSHFFGAARSSQSPTRSPLAAVKRAILPWVPALVVILPTYGYAAYVGGWRDMWDQIVVYNMINQHVFYSGTFPAPTMPLTWGGNIDFWTGWPFSFWLEYYSALVIYPLAFAYYVYALFSRRIVWDLRHLGTIAVAIFGILLFLPALVTIDPAHGLAMWIVAFLVVVLLFWRIALSSRFPVKLILLALLMGLTALTVGFPIQTTWSNVTSFPLSGCYSQIERANCIEVYEYAEQAVEYVRAHTKEGEPIFVGNQSHAATNYNDVGFYFLSNRPSATRYYMNLAGLTTTLPVQKTIVQEIESKNVNYIVLADFFPYPEPASSGVHFLDDFIRTNYVPVAEFYNYAIWERASEKP